MRDPVILVLESDPLLPFLCLGQIFFGHDATLFLEQAPNFRRHPSKGMNPVGHMLDGDFRFGNPRPDTLPHTPGNTSVDSTHPVGLPGKTQSQDGHAERLRFLIGPRAAKLQKIRKINPAFFHILSKIFFHQDRLKSIVPRRNRSVRGKHTIRRNGLQCLDKTQFFLNHETPDSFQPQESGMALVHMEHRGLKTHRL